MTLALGIGGTTAIFSLIHAVMLRSLPVADPASLYRVGDGSDCCVQGGPQDNWGMYPYAFYKEIERATPEFESVAAFQAAAVDFSVRRAKLDRSAQPLRGEFVTGNYFSTFGIRPFAGRLLSPKDDLASSPPVAVVSDRLWKQTYGSEPSIVGSTIIVESHPFTVVGIAPPGFYGETLRSNPPEIWLPLGQEPLVHGKESLKDQRISAWLRVIGRLRPGASPAAIGPRLTGMLRGWLMNDAGFPSIWLPQIKQMLPKQIIQVVPAGSGVAQMKEDYGRTLQILLVVCGLVLLIACANTANLLLARGMARRLDMSLRLAIGASRSRLVRQALTESVLLAIGGGIAGLLVADGAGRLILALAFNSVRSLPIGSAPSLPALAFAFGLSLVTGVLFGTAPAWFATRTDPIEALRGSNRSTADSSSFSRNALLILQATLSVVLIAGAGLLTRSLRNLENQDLGFAVKHRITVDLNPPPATYNQDRLDALYRSLEQKLNHIPGVQHASLAMYNPLTGHWSERVTIQGRPVGSFDANHTAAWDRVSANYLPTLGTSVLRGRNFNEHDTAHSQPVAVVNEAFVKRFLSHEDPLGKHFGMDLPELARTFQIVGEINDAKFSDPTRPAEPMFFVPLAQRVNYANPLMQKLVEDPSHFIHSALLETNLDPGKLQPILRKVLSDADPNLSIIDVRTMQQQIDLEFNQQRAVAGLAGLFGLVALVLAGVGLYGVTAYSVARRTSEIGVRMALGATRQNIIQLILQGAFGKVAIGLLLGIPLSIGAGRLLSAQLFGVASWDPITLLIALASLAVCAFIAAIVPAWRAATVHPMHALHTQ